MDKEDDIFKIKKRVFFAIKIVSVNPWVLKDFKDSFKNDIDIVSVALKINGFIFKVLSDELRDNKNIDFKICEPKWMGIRVRIK